jgi:hypothetical protein
VQVIRQIALGLFIILTGACASKPGDRASQETTKKPPRGVVVEFHVTYYDGEKIRGRVLIGATIDPLVVYSHMLESADLELVNIRACGEDHEAPHIIFDLVALDPEKFTTIRPGYWYGKNVVYGLFYKKRVPGPDCVEAELEVQDSASRIVAKLPIRVVRTDKPPAPPDGGAPAEPKPPASDAGTP